MTTVLLFALCILTSGAAGNLFRQLSAESRNAADSAGLPFFWYLPLCLVFLIPAGSAPGKAVIPVAAAGGICLFAAAFLLLESMKQTSLAASVIIVNLNFLIPVLLSVTLLKEHAAPLQLAGMLLSAAVVVFLNRDGGEKKGEGGGFRVLLLPLAACLSNGLLNFFIKLNETAGGDRGTFFAILYGTAAFCSLSAGMLIRLSERRRAGAGHTEPENENTSPGRYFPPLGRKTLPPAAALAVCNGLCFWSEGVLAGRVNAAAQFTVVTAASIAFSLAVGAIWQREPLRLRTAASFAACLCAILCQAVSL